MRSAVLCFCCVGVTWLTGCLGSDSPPVQTAKSEATVGAARAPLLAEKGARMPPPEFQSDAHEQLEYSRTALDDDANRIASDWPVAKAASAGAVTPEAGSDISLKRGLLEGPDVLEMDGAGESIDRLAQELMASMRHKPTLALWLFDTSLSLRPRRQLIADRFEKVYGQIAAANEGEPARLSTVVATFGKEYDLITKEPVKDIQHLIPKIRALKNDDSGKEMVFHAVKNLAMTFHKHRNQNGGQNLVLFIVTDEPGDDPPFLEEGNNAVPQVRHSRFRRRSRDDPGSSGTYRPLEV